MKGKRNKFLVGLVLLIAGLILPGLGETKAASSYNNAREFYESTGKNDPYHAEVYGGTIYYATKAKLASSSVGKKYSTVGYDVILEGNGQTVSFSVKRNGDGTMQEVSGSRKEHGGYMYNLYSIPKERLFELAEAANPTAAAVVREASKIDVYIHSIMTINLYGELKGGVTENGYGGLHEWGKVYHLMDTSDLSRIRGEFPGHMFYSFFNIKATVDNHQFSVRYKLDGGSVTGNYTSVDDVLYLNGSPVVSSARVMDKISLQNQGVAGLYKTGYHVEAGKEWSYDNRAFDQNKRYFPTEIVPESANQEVKIHLYANWKPNTYTITYDANGGSGYMHTTEMTYDQAKNLRKNGYTRNGYYFNGWNTARDGSGTPYEDQKSVSNLTSVHNGNIILYAQWEPLIFTISTDKQGGSGGTDMFYEQYATGWYLNPNATGATTSIVVPQKRGYEFRGYHMSIYGLGDMIVNSAGVIGFDNDGEVTVTNTYFTRDSLIYANWKAKQYTITFDKQGGYGGTDSAKVFYEQELPTADAPVRTGYSFKGYYTEPDGAGEAYYNEFMAAEKQKYEVDGNMTLYAYWVDDVAPTVYLSANYDEWTNRDIILEALAYDHGSGLASLTLYQGDTEIISITEVEDPANPVKMLLTHINEPEGVIRYRAVAVDKEGNTAEVFKTIYSDTTAPKGTVTFEFFDGQNIEIEVFVDDWKVE